MTTKAAKTTKGTKATYSEMVLMREVGMTRREAKRFLENEKKMLILMICICIGFIIGYFAAEFNADNHTNAVFTEEAYSDAEAYADEDFETEAATDENSKIEAEATDEDFETKAATDENSETEAEAADENSETEAEATDEDYETETEDAYVDSEYETWEEESEDVYSGAEETVYDNAIEYSEDDFEIFCSLAYGEAGPAEGYDCIVGTMWEIRNGIMQRCNGNFGEEIFHPYRYSTVEDGIIYCGEGIASTSIIPEEYQEIARRVLSGEIPDPTYGATAYVAYQYWADSGEEFAEKYSIDNYVVLGAHIFFSEEEWPFG